MAAIDPGCHQPGGYGSAHRDATTSEIAPAAPLPYDTTARLVLPAGVKDERGRPLANAGRFPPSTYASPTRRR